MRRIANAALKSPPTIAKLEAAQFDALGGSPTDFAAFIAHETAKWRMVAEATGLRK